MPQNYTLENGYNSTFYVMCILPPKKKKKNSDASPSPILETLSDEM